MPPKGKYTDPKLRDKVKEEIQSSDKGGEPGQWSARKAQFMAAEYKKRGGGYTTDKETGQDESQKNLSKWSEEDWQTKEGSGNAKREDGTQKRYLPKKAWEDMTEEEKKETDDKKQAESKEGKQHVANTGKAKSARQKANNEENQAFDKKKEKQGNEGKAGNENGSAPRRSSRNAKKNDEQEKDQGKNTSKDEKEAEQPKSGNKRSANTSEESNKKQKANNGEGKPKNTIGSKHDSAEEPAPAASKDRLPKKGQRASWKALPGWVHGEVLEIVTESKQVDGKSVKASKSDPRIVLKSDNGKTAVHKATAVHFSD